MADGEPQRTQVTKELGADLIDNPLFNKGTAFTAEERGRLRLEGLLPPQIETLDLQVQRAYDAFKRKDSDLERHIYLRALQDTNEVLFYRLLHAHLAEMMPIIYTPVVGAACQQFSEIYRRPRGLFIAYPERERIDAILANAPLDRVTVIVVTDGERILGLGDQGTGGMGIPIGKLSLYTACGGISPHNTLPIVLDVGTNNQERLEDPLYIGWRHERVTGADYDAFLDLFVQAVKRRWPKVLLQFEDFAQTHAAPLLARYRDQLCTFNDDIQGTAAVTVGTLLAAAKVSGKPLSEQRVALFGAGSAGCGIAEQLVQAMVKEGLSEAEARARFYMIDRPGLLHDGIDNLLPFQTKLLQPHAEVADWASGPDGRIGFMDVMRNAKPSVLVGVSGQPNTFTREAIVEMAKHCERPIVFPLSNPTSRIEATPADIIAWTEGRALVATGSPFQPVSFGGESYPIAQCNNSYIFPAMGLGILASGATRVSDGMFMAAAEALSSQAPALKAGEGALLPLLSEVRSLAMAIGRAVARQAQAEGLAENCSEAALEARLKTTYWQPRYPELQTAE
ncbi:MAG: NAD-dependent malic enzyme [Rhodospirillales bacterium]